tara:strand:+ start:1486 stop:1971 length:486 start_codon:yes stop_codon:yes gene_type:complete
MSSKLFKNDKNYILKIAQKETKTQLISYLINEAIKKYELKSNPLGLIYKPYLKSEKINVTELMKLDFFYRKISTIYRYNYGEVQLSFLWDGSSHNEFYKRKWISFFKKETSAMISNDTFIKSLLMLTKNKNINKLQYKISTFIRKKFNIQVYKKKGVVLHS